MKAGRALLVTGALVVAGALVAWRALTSHWTLTTAAGSCVIAQGMARAEVLTECGRPMTSGMQPKVPGRPFPRMCSAECDRYSDHLVFYDCDGRVAKAERIQPGVWQHCSIGSIE